MEHVDQSKITIGTKRWRVKNAAQPLAAAAILLPS
jgi:hypothetical protein